MIENEVAYEAAKKRRIYANAYKGRVKRFNTAYPGLREKIALAWGDKRTKLPPWIYQALTQWGGLTDKQAAVAIKCLTPDVERDHEQAIAEEVARNTVTPWSAGRQDVSGVVVSARWVATQFGSVIKALIVTSEGRKLWTSIPSAIAEDPPVLKGKTVSIRVTVQPKDGDPIFAFGSRPKAA